MRLLELFAGSQTLTNVAKNKGMETFTVDNDPNITPSPDLIRDVREITLDNLPVQFDIVWASPPCESFSVASIGKHWHLDNTPKTEQAKESLQVIEATVKLIKDLKPKYWFIENPRGKLRKLIPYIPGMVRHTVTYCQYGETRMKPTDIWTNCANWKPRPMCSNGSTCHVSAPRGSRTGTQGYKNYYERSKLPEQLCKEVLEACL